MSGEFAAALCHVVNEWLLEYCSADPKRLRAVGLIPCQAPEIAVKELEFLAKAGAISAMLPTNVYGRNMGDPMFFQSTKRRKKLAQLSVHPQTSHEGIPESQRVAGSRAFSSILVHMTAFPFEADRRMRSARGSSTGSQGSESASWKAPPAGCRFGWSVLTSISRSSRPRCRI
jgi:hypothetical protein